MTNAAWIRIQPGYYECGRHILMSVWSNYGPRGGSYQVWQHADIDADNAVTISGEIQEATLHGAKARFDERVRQGRITI